MNSEASYLLVMGDPFTRRWLPNEQPAGCLKDDTTSIGTTAIIHKTTSFLKSNYPVCENRLLWLVLYGLLTVALALSTTQ